MGWGLGLTLGIFVHGLMDQDVREPSLNPTAFVERADKTLYRAKDGGRDQYVVSEEP